MKGLYPKIMLLICGVYIVAMVTILNIVYATEDREIVQVGLKRAETLNQMAFEALYTSMRQGGGRGGNRQVIARLQNTGVFNQLRVVIGEPVIRQFGVQADGFPQDDLERRGLAGEEVQQVRWVHGYPVVRYVTPLRVRAECQRCHQAEIGAINGVISTEISLEGYQSTLRQHQQIVILMLTFGLLALGLLTFYVLNWLVLRPLQWIQQGTKAIVRGDLSYRLQVNTGDELEALAGEFNRMTQWLQESYGKVAEERSTVVAAIEASRDAIWISDADRRIVMVNSALERLTGRHRNELLNQSCRYLLGVHLLGGISICDATCPFLLHPMETSNDGRVEGYIPTSSGKEAWVEISYGWATDSDGHLKGVVHIVHDLTQRKEVERLKDEFVSLVSHELRTPLHHIKGFATTLLQTDVEWDVETQRDFLGSINREVDRLSDLVEKILHISRLETEGLPMEKEGCLVEDLVDGALRRRRNLTVDRQVQLHLQQNLPSLFVDGREIEVVLMNLIENAVKYSDPGTPIVLEVNQKGDQVRFSVIDQGVGIPPEQQDHIFERFYRVNGKEHHVSGTGLGLAICKRIVESHRGHIWVESIPGVGSCFSFHIPIGTENEYRETISGHEQGAVRGLP